MEKKTVKKKIEVNLLAQADEDDKMTLTPAPERKHIKPRIACGCLIVGHGLCAETEVKPWMMQWLQQLSREYDCDLRYATVAVCDSIDIAELRTWKSLKLASRDVMFVWMRNFVQLKNVSACDVVLWKDVDQSVPEQCYPRREKDTSVYWAAVRKLLIASNTPG
jgi:hypothetical protein